MRFPNRLIRHVELPALSQDQIRQMVGLYRADLRFALERNSCLLDFVNAMPADTGEKYYSLDVKVVMLKPGWLPCIPGWHLDDFYRPDGKQPDLANLPAHNSRHFMAIYGDCCLTEFLTEPIELPVPLPSELSGPIYGHYNRLIGDGEREHLKLLVASESLWEFDSLTWHRGVAAYKEGWRALVRCTLGNERPPRNEVRTQTNVYIPERLWETGW